MVYDLQEPFRWLADLTVIQAFESGTLKLRDFYFMGDDYRYRFEVEAKKRFIELLRERFNAGTNYKDRVLKWDTVIEQKTVELSRFLNGKSPNIDFREPSPILERTDNVAIRKRILSLSQQDADRLGVGKNTLHYLRRNATANQPFTVYGKVRQRLQVPEQG